MFRVMVKRGDLEIALIRKNYTRKLLAYEMWVSRNYLSSIFTGKREASAAIRQRLLELFKGYTFDDLFIITEENHDGTDSE